MPTYEYECLNCGHNFEAFQKMSDKHLSSCPLCGKEVRRLISSGAGIIFKGSGFYATDYRKKTSLAGGDPDKAKAGDSAAATCPKAKEGCEGCSGK